jgi:hypothetical protein
MAKRLWCVSLLAMSIAVPFAAEAQVSVNVNVGPPPIIFPAPPRVVLVPQTPVHYVPATTYNVFFYNGRYYSFHDGAWFLASSHAGPWAFLPAPQVPRPVLAVPVRYYKVPPGHAKHWDKHHAKHWDKHEGKHHGKHGKHGKRHKHDD